MLFNQLHKGIYIIHENPEWIPPFAQAFQRAQIPFNEILLTQGAFTLHEPPPQGVFWSRLSASSHTRNHALAKDYGRALLLWLEAHGRCVINGSSVLEIEVSKVRQSLLLDAHFNTRKEPFTTPKTLAICGKEGLKDALKHITPPFITKHNQGGKGLGVRLFNHKDEWIEYIESSDYELPIDGITLFQEYIASKEPFITRCEFIGGKFHYAVRVDTSSGGFELCPADTCSIIDDAQESSASKSSALASNPPTHTKADASSSRYELASAACAINTSHKFSLRHDIHAHTPIIISLEHFLQQHHIAIAGVEFIEKSDGGIVIYDINTNTNYNSALESSIRDSGGVSAADRVVSFLAEELAALA